MKKLVVMLASVLLLVSCGSNTVATVGNIKISKGEFEFYLDSIKTQMQDTEIQTEEDWQNKEIEGKKAIDIAKQQALDNAVQNALYIEAAEAAGHTLTEEERKLVETTKEQIVSGYGNKKAYKEFLESNNIDDGFIEMMCKSSVYYKKIGDIVKSQDDVTEEEKKAYFQENMSDYGTEIRKAKHILIATMNPETNKPKTQEEQDEASRLAKEIYERVQVGEDFDKLMHEYSEDPGLQSKPDGYVFGSGEMVPEFEQATDSVGYGEIAFCKSDFGYHIIKRLPIAYEDVEMQIENDIYGSLVEEQVEKWQKEYSIKVVKNEKVIAEIK